MVIFEVNAATKAQNTVNTLNGLFTPTKSQRYFQEGRRDFDIQVEILNDPDYYFNQQIPQFDEELLNETLESSPLNSASEHNSNREIPTVEKNAL